METQIENTQPNNTETELVSSPVDIKFKLSAIWISMLFVFAYVDIFGLFRAEVINDLLEGTIHGTPFQVTQGFLVSALVYILPASLMVLFSLTMSPKVNRRVNITVAAIYILTIIAGCVGEEAIYYLLGSAVEVVLLGVLIRMAVKWPTTSKAVASKVVA